MTSPFPFSGAAVELNEIVTVAPNKIKGKVKKQSASASSEGYTTVVYQKEPPQESPYVTYESLKKTDGFSKNAIPAAEKVHKEISENDINIHEKTLSKEVEMYSGIPNVLIKLNRTSRKELPMMQEPKTKDSATTVANLELVQEPKYNVEEILIDPKIEDLNANFSENNESEIFIITPTKIAPERLQKQNDSVKEEKLPTQPVLEQKITATEEPPEPVPQPHPKPNRKRQLTRPQSRSFYPYFFSRVLG